MITHGGRLPAEASRFFGRSQEAAAAKDALAGARLVTLTGPGGIGKTRLAVKVASEVAVKFPDGVFIADLSEARDVAGVAAALAAALGRSRPERAPSPDSPQQEPFGWLAGQLSGKRPLLILDTCEHVIEECAALADTLLSGSGAVLLVTSRQPLDLPGEVVLRIPPLTAEADGDAVRLFADRAAAALPGFRVSRDTLPKIMRLCRLLDGLPLAIELAALRLRAVGLDELLVRLPGRLGLLGNGRHAVAASRQQSLQTSIAWSYELCTPLERLLWSRLSVFADGFDLAAVEQVCAGGQLSADAVLDTLVGLVDKSVVLRAADVAGVARYQLLEVVREHGAGHATEAGVYAARHRDYYFGLARAFAASFAGPDQLTLVATLARDAANLRIAFEGVLAAGDAARTLEFATACWPWQASTGRLAQAGGWLARALQQEQERVSDSERQQASALPASLAPGLTPGAGTALAQLRQLAIALSAWIRTAQGNIQAADALRPLLSPPAPPARAGHGPASTGPAVTGLAAAGIGAGPQDRTEPGPASLSVLPLITGFDVAFEALRRGLFADCAAHCDDLAASLPPGERWVRGWAAWVKGLAGWFAGDRVMAGVRLRAGLELLAPFGSEQAIALHLEAFAWLAAGRKDFRRAARLHGAADRIWQRQAAREGVKAPRLGLPLLHAERERSERLARDVLKAAAYATEHAAGAALSREAALKDVMPGTQAPSHPQASAISGPGELRPAVSPVLVPEAYLTTPAYAFRGVEVAAGPGSGPTDPDAAFAGRWDVLTAREREVAGLVAKGLTNKDIAARLVVSKRTVDAHLEHILAKLGYSSRVQVAALAAHERDRQHRERARERRELSSGPSAVRRLR